MEQFVKEYFETHPEATEIHVTGNVVFVKITNANEYAKGATVETITRQQIEDEAKHEEIDEKKLMMPKMAINNKNPSKKNRE